MEATATTTPAELATALYSNIDFNRSASAGAAAPVDVARLPRLDADTWALRTDSVAQRIELLKYAASKGMPTSAKVTLDEDSADIGFVFSGQCLIDYRGCQPGIGWTTPEQFKAMCDAYAANR